MMDQEIVKIAPRGQIVIPKKFREVLHLEIGNRMFIKETAGKLILEKVHFNEMGHYEEIKQKRLDYRLREEGEVFV